ncbi:MAG: alpha-1,4-glucan--maltose-1-phosphate maltosyltransferase [Steroidobacteraceae bacterium]
MTKTRVVIEGLSPRVDCGRFPARRVLGDSVTVEADVFADGHDAVTASVLYRHESETQWHGVPMSFLGNDRWQGRFTVQTLGRYFFTVEAWVDHLESWRRALAKKHQADQDIEIELQQGAALALAHAGRVAEPEARRLREWANALTDPVRETGERALLAQSEALYELTRRSPDRELVLRREPPLAIAVDRERARFSSWYEMFPRSAAPRPGEHGTLADVETLLPYVASMGFDVLYLPPIHPIGEVERKGPNNRTGASPGDPGSPWAIGSRQGGHKDVHPRLGTLADFHRLLASAGALGIELALDIAFQCAPDHPYVREHPEWFLKRPDGRVQYAENPPKKYQDIYPFWFECEDWQALWAELKSVFEFWIAQGVRIFRVDNPHTKPFAFWEWVIGEIHRAHPEVIFLAEAFTRPKVLYRLAKLGFTQSYNYFPWRNSKREIVEYFTELTSRPLCEFFRPSLWPNTPDILTEYLQFGGRPAFVTRLILAATLGASYGVYGPPFELMDNRPRESGSEEYLDSEKYEPRSWSRDDPASLKDLITRLNRIRRENPALQSNAGLRFHPIDNEALIAYSKTSDEDSILVVVNVDPHHAQTGWLQLELTALALPVDAPYQMDDLISGARFLWRGARNYVALDPAGTAAHLFRIRRKVRSERDFDYFL